MQLQALRDGLHLRNCLRASENDAVGLKLFPSVSSLSTSGNANFQYAAASGPICIPPSGLTYLTGYQPITGQHTTLRRALLKAGFSGINTFQQSQFEVFHFK
jgi:hypothetical protein